MHANGTEWPSDLVGASVTQMIEIWRSIGVRGYEVSSYGRVRSWRRRGNPSGPLSDAPVILKPVINSSGYLLIGIHSDKQRLMYIHRLVLTAFCGPCPQGQEACHFDGDRTNARLDNLRWDTRKNNHSDAIRHGTHSSLTYFGENHFNAKLTAESVREIKRRLANGARVGLLAREFGVKQPCISSIKSGANWSHIT